MNLNRRVENLSTSKRRPPKTANCLLVSCTPSRQSWLQQPGFPLPMEANKWLHGLNRWIKHHGSKAEGWPNLNYNLRSAVTVAGQIFCGIQSQLVSFSGGGVLLQGPRVCFLFGRPLGFCLEGQQKETTFWLGSPPFCQIRTLVSCELSCKR